jgi:hypothetical protein
LQKRSPNHFVRRVHISPAEILTHFSAKNPDFVGNQAFSPQNGLNKMDLTPAWSKKILWRGLLSMSREQIYHSIILKKQPYREADEIITLYTLELGKLRVLARSLKAAKSKLQQSLQALFLVEVRTAGSRDFPQVIGAEVIQSFAGIRENLRAAKYAFYACELALKFSPDEQKNEPLYFLLRDFFNFLDGCGPDEVLMAPGLAKFKLDLLDAVGLAVPPAGLPSGEAKLLFGELSRSPFANLAVLTLNSASLSALQKYLSQFILKELEREVKSESLMEI